MQITRVLWLMAVTGSAIGVLAPVSLGALPPYTVTRTYQSGDECSGGRLDRYPVSTRGFYGGAGILGLSINNSGAGYVHVGLYQQPPPPVPLPAIFGDYNHAVLFTGTGLAPYLAGGVEWDGVSPGSVTVPSTSYIYDESFGTAINNNGDGAFDLRLGSSTFASVTPVTGVYFNKTAMPIREGDVITASGVCGGGRSLVRWGRIGSRGMGAVHR